MANEQFCLRWNNFQSNIITNLESLKCDEDLVDVTLTCEGRSVKAHKVILSACSSYFRSIFKENPCPHPVVILKGVTFMDISSLISFMYQGEVHITQDQLSSFLRTAELLQIRGLADIASPNSISSSEEIPLKKQEDKNEISTCLGAPSSVPETVSSPPQKSPFPCLYESEASSPHPSPSKQPFYESSHSLHPPSSPLPLQAEAGSVQSGKCLTGSESGEGEEEDICRKGEELWKVPKEEPMESGNEVSLQQIEGGGRGEGTPPFDWYAFRSESLHHGPPLLENMNSQLPVAATHQEAEMTLEFVNTEKGKRKLYLEGQLYFKDKQAGTKVYWRCEKYQKTKCGARVTTVGDDVIKRSDAHNHVADAAHVEASKIIDNIRTNAKLTQDAPRNIISNAYFGISQAAAASLPSEDSIMRIIRNVRKKHTAGPAVPTRRADIVFPEPYTKTNL